MVNSKDIPKYLKENAKFCNWKYETHDGKLTKVPYNPHTNNKASVNNLNTFTDFNSVINALDNYDGIGIRTERINELNTIVKNEQEKVTNASSFLNLVKCYTNITKLDAEIIRTFIERVYIYSVDTTSSRKIKKIRIVFNFIGEINLPVKNTK
jgi:hypothetical protein